MTRTLRFSAAPHVRKNKGSDSIHGSLIQVERQPNTARSSRTITTTMFSLPLPGNFLVTHIRDHRSPFSSSSTSGSWLLGLCRLQPVYWQLCTVPSTTFVGEIVGQGTTRVQTSWARSWCCSSGKNVLFQDWWPSCQQLLGWSVHSNTVGSLPAQSTETVQVISTHRPICCLPTLTPPPILSFPR